MTLTTVSAYLTSNNSYSAIVIPSTDTCIISPTDEVINDFYADDAGFSNWSGTSIVVQISPISVDNLTDHEIAELFGRIVRTRYC